MKEKTSNTGEQPNILIAIPAYGGMIHFKTSEALRVLDWELTKLGITHTLRYLGNESLITRARNWFANLALIGKEENGKPFTHLLFLDADIIFSPANVVEVFQANLPIVALPYSKKGFDWANVATAAKAGVPADQLPHYAGSPVFGIDGEFDLSQASTRGRRWNGRDNAIKCFWPESELVLHRPVELAAFTK